jgi:hypothetical protein
MKQNWQHVPELAGRLDAFSFPDRDDGTVVLTFEDGSVVVFQHAFTCMEGEWVVVYTEHCGYHAFLAESLMAMVPEPYNEEEKNGINFAPTEP